MADNSPKTYQQIMARIKERSLCEMYQQQWPREDESKATMQALMQKLMETTQLLVAKEQRIAEQDQQIVRQAITLARELGSREVLDMFWPLVQKLYETTNSAGEHAQCKAALEAYRALGVPANAGAPASAPEGLGVQTMGNPNVSDGRDRQAGQGAGASGSQLLGEPKNIPNSPWIRL